MNDNSIPTIEFRKLYVDSGYEDQTFKKFVERWMQQLMPGFPMGLLDTSSELACERWNLECPRRHHVENKVRSTWCCTECDTEYESNEECCTDEDGARIELTEQRIVVHVVFNETTSEYVADQGYTRSVRLSEDGTLTGGELYWELDDDAEEAARKADDAFESERGHEHNFGFPWAHSWVHLPDRYIDTDDLKDAGFRVAVYVGGAGDARTDDEFRLAGIDGGGYSFDVHFARLIALHCIRRNWTVETDSGEAYVTFDYRSNLEKLTDAQ